MESSKVAPAGPVITFDGSDHVRRLRPDGSVLWSTALPGNARSVRPPDLVVAGELVLVAAWDKRASFIVALHADGGAEQWRVPTVADRLFVHDGTIMSTDCSALEPPAQRWLVGRRMNDGRELWRMELPLSADPDPLVAQGALARVLARDMGAAMTYVFRPGDGEIVLKLAEYVMASVEAGGKTVYASDRRVASYDGGEQLWQLPPLRGDEAGFATAPDGDLIVYAFSGHADSGVHLLRLSPEAGKVKWLAMAEPLGVSHSKYFHQAYARVLGDHVVVVSQGAFGDFVEVIDYATGNKLQRHKI